MLAFPYRSIWAGLIMTCREPCQARSKIARNGIQPSAGPGGGWPSAQVPVTKRASPSDSSRSGSNVALASRAPAVGIWPIGLAAISPSPRHASAQATMHTSARAALPPAVRAAGRHRRAVTLSPAPDAATADW